ncbi:hypothetical protein MtrunA17_Chr3g0107861 [Medicago truncatula]|uniref:Transmembrane protein n=1 Tax=Medicago truncatula TaxID=3880 RepID=A0A396ITC8_MEDTR|nr:hypothetical protein MtrunA17_Chr3g0107861 [Medicago truncatula]
MGLKGFRPVFVACWPIGISCGSVLIFDGVGLLVVNMVRLFEIGCDCWIRFVNDMYGFG